MSNKKLLLGSDYDGTFRRWGELPEPEDVEAVKEFRSAGNIFGIVTGRTPSELAWVLDKFGDICDFLLCATGGVCLFPDKRIAFTSETTTEDFFELYRICRECGAVHVHSDAMSLKDEYVTLEELYLAFPGEDADDKFYINGYVNSFSHNVCVKPEAMSGIKTFTQFTAYFEKGEDTARTIEVIDAAFPGKYKCHYLGTGFDMTPAGVSKTRGIAAVAKHFGIGHDCIWTAGDGWNDLDMLKSYKGIAMSGSAREIIDAAVYETKNVAEGIGLIMKG